MDNLLDTTASMVFTPENCKFYFFCFEVMISIEMLHIKSKVQNPDLLINAETSGKIITYAQSVNLPSLWPKSKRWRSYITRFTWEVDLPDV